MSFFRRFKFKSLVATNNATLAAIKADLEAKENFDDIFTDNTITSQISSIQNSAQLVEQSEIGTVIEKTDGSQFVKNAKGVWDKVNPTSGAEESTGSTGSSELTWTDWAEWDVDAFSTYVYSHSFNSDNGFLPVAYEFVMHNDIVYGQYNSRLYLKKRSAYTRYSDIKYWDVSTGGYNASWLVRLSYSTTDNVAIGVYPSYRPPGYKIYARMGYTDAPGSFIEASSFTPTTSAPIGYINSSSFTVSSSNGYPNDTYNFGSADGSRLENINAVSLNSLPISTTAPTDGQILSYNDASSSLDWVDMPTGGAEESGGGSSSTWFSHLSGSMSSSDYIPWASDASVGGSATLGYGQLSPDGQVTDPNATYCCWSSGYYATSDHRNWYDEVTTMYSNYANGMQAAPYGFGNGVFYTVIINPNAHSGFSNSVHSYGTSGYGTDLGFCMNYFSPSQKNFFVLKISAGGMTASDFSSDHPDFTVEGVVDAANGFGTLVYGTFTGASCGMMYWDPGSYAAYSLNVYTMY